MTLYVLCDIWANSMHLHFFDVCSMQIFKPPRAYHHHDNQVRVIQTFQLPMTLGINLNDVSTQLLGPRLLGKQPFFRDVRHGVSWWQDTKSPVLSHFFADLLPENSQTTQLMQLLIHVSDYEFVILSGMNSAQAHTGSFGYLSHNLDNDNEYSGDVSAAM